MRSNLAEVLECWMLSFAVMSDVVGGKEISGQEFMGFIYTTMPMKLHFERP